ncbi:hypothetical protein GYMLUDRAFT_58521 [Collybiopsis luxurians FD-317 M1]|uniref:RNase H type-1 domain-containing protein n=1 Tax=Collybiopsis luxurians FD-317 M1 TaxID=944289 RepID=A0A0D0C132_9AGAR|nr:hypothetical protein GYMLUDRAFT_58521 [Collybiopsis luxurians FD-317 M1]
MHVINTIKKARAIEDGGYENLPNGQLVRAVIASFRERMAPVYVKWVKGHTGHPRNEGADEMAKIALTKGKASFINLRPCSTLTVTGSKLSALTQSQAYKAIMNLRDRNRKKRRRAEINIMRAQNCTEDRFEYIPTEERIWESMRSKEYDQKIRDFLWKITHDAYWTGTHWLRENMPSSMKERAICKFCNEIEDMDHILTKCDAPGQTQLWNLTRNLWEIKKSDLEWFKPTLGDIIGCGMARIYGHHKDKPHPGHSRLWRIIIAETAYLIWTLRCRRVIEFEGARHFTEEELIGHWKKAINSRLELDCNMTKSDTELKQSPTHLC